MKRQKELNLPLSRVGPLPELAIRIVVQAIPSFRPRDQRSPSFRPRIRTWNLFVQSEAYCQIVLVGINRSGYGSRALGEFRNPGPLIKSQLLCL